MVGLGSARETKVLRSLQEAYPSVCAAAGGRKRARRRSRREDDEGVSSRDKGQFPPEKWGKSERRDRILTGLCVLGPGDEGIVPF